MLPAPAWAASGGRIGAGSLPHAKAVGESLTYDSFSNFSCSQAGFTTDAIARMDIAGHVLVQGSTRLNGVPYDTYFDDLETGPDTFPTEFFRPRVGDPPFDAGSNSYTFAFSSRVTVDGRTVGTSVTTITCTAGAFSAFNEWIPGPEPVPAGHPAAWAALALLLAAAAARRLAARRP